MPVLPALVAHADWSVNTSKRWMAYAVQTHSGQYLAGAPLPVGEPGNFLMRLQEIAGVQASLLVGFDFPIGLPVKYAHKVAISNFLDVLPELGWGKWAQFYDVAAGPDQIQLWRPFYPSRAGSARQSHLLQALGVDKMDDLRRRCELRQPGRRAACSLFWTLGGQQVGKAAISGWRTVLTPALRSQSTFSQANVLIWPFSGALHDLLGPGRTVIAETYPAEFYTHLGLTFSSAGLNAPRRLAKPKASKRSQPARAANAATLSLWAEQAGVILTPALRQVIQDGFGSAVDGEDRFDALVGLFGMLNVLLGRRSPGEPEEVDIRYIEGWILGQAGQNPV